MLRKSSFVDFPFILIDPSFALREYLQYVTVKFAQIRANVIFFSKNLKYKSNNTEKNTFKKNNFQIFPPIVVHFTTFCGKLPIQ